MACEDFPCCGHTSEDPCPIVDSRGRIVPMCCECGKRMSKKRESSICSACQRRMSTASIYDDFDYSMNY